MQILLRRLNWNSFVINIAKERNEGNPQVWNMRETQRCISKIDHKHDKIVMFYSSPLDSEFIEFEIPNQMNRISMDTITLVEPFYIFALGIDHRGRD